LARMKESLWKKPKEKGDIVTGGDIVDPRKE
jgi:hypothetical protein